MMWSNKAPVSSSGGVGMKAAHLWGWSAMQGAQRALQEALPTAAKSYVSGESLTDRCLPRECRLSLQSTLLHLLTEWRERGAEEYFAQNVSVYSRFLIFFSSFKIGSLRFSVIVFGVNYHLSGGEKNGYYDSLVLAISAPLFPLPKCNNNRAIL